MEEVPRQKIEDISEEDIETLLKLLEKPDIQFSKAETLNAGSENDPRTKLFDREDNLVCIITTREADIIHIPRFVSDIKAVLSIAVVSESFTDNSAIVSGRKILLLIPKDPAKLISAKLL